MYMSRVVRDMGDNKNAAAVPGRRCSNLPCAGRWNAATYTTSSSSAPRDSMARRRRRSEHPRRSRYWYYDCTIVIINCYAVRTAARWTYIVLYYYCCDFRTVLTRVVLMLSICWRTGRVDKICIGTAGGRLRARVCWRHARWRSFERRRARRPRLWRNYADLWWADGRAGWPCSGSRALSSTGNVDVTADRCCTSLMIIIWLLLLSSLLWLLLLKSYRPPSVFRDYRRRVVSR